MSLKIQVERHKLEKLCKKHHITKLAFFGSVMRDDFGPNSDVDIMLEFASDKVPGWEIVSILDEFSELFDGRKVDFMTFKQLKPNTRLAHFVAQDLEVYCQLLPPKGGSL